MGVMIAINGVFASYEIALASVSLARLEHLNHENQPGAQSTLHMKRHIEASLSMVQLAITLVGSIAAAVGGAGAGTRLAPLLQNKCTLTPGVSEILAIACVVIPLTGITILIGELIPKVFALRHPEWVCLNLSPYMRGIVWGVWPVVWLSQNLINAIIAWSERHFVEKTTASTNVRQELHTLVAMARAEALIGHREEGIILGATALPVRPIRDIMLPAGYICSLDSTVSLEENLQATHRDMHTRFPVEARPGDPQSITGYVNVKDLIYLLHQSLPTASLQSILRPLPELQEDCPIALALEQLIHARTHIALVRNEQAQVVGMVSLEDIIEELVGEIEDEYDRLPSHLVASGEDWIAGGGVTLKQLQMVTGHLLFTPDAANEQQTLNEWARQHTKTELKGGLILDTSTMQLMVRKVRRHQLQEAHIRFFNPG